MHAFFTITDKLFTQFYRQKEFMNTPSLAVFLSVNNAQCSIDISADAIFMLLHPRCQMRNIRFIAKFSLCIADRAEPFRQNHCSAERQAQLSRRFAFDRRTKHALGIQILVIMQPAEFDRRHRLRPTLFLVACLRNFFPFAIRANARLIRNALPEIRFRHHTQLNLL